MKVERIYRLRKRGVGTRSDRRTGCTAPAAPAPDPAGTARGNAARGHRPIRRRARVLRRPGGGVRPGFEGGQNPLFRRLPKRGFTNINIKEYAIVNLDTLNCFDEGTEVTPALLLETGYVSSEKAGIKILGNGSLDRKLTVKAHKFSASAKEAIETAGGQTEVV